MQTYEIIVSGRAVHANSADTTLVRTSIGIDKIHVLFDNKEWTAFPVRVTFANGDTIISTSLTLAEIDAPEWAAEAECAIPWEVIQDLGGIRITFQGTDASGNHIITEASGEPLSVVEAGDVGSGTVPSPAPSIDEWNQAYANAMAAANSASGAAESANEAAERANTAAAEAEQVLVDGIPLMDADTRGGAKLGDGLEVDENETLNAKVGGDITIDGDGAISYELPIMSATQHGGATLGSGLRVDDGALSLGDLTQSASGAEVVTDGCAIFSVSGDGWATQDGTPTPDNPVEIEVARGRNLLDIANLSVLNAYTDTNGKATESASDRALIIPVQPSTQYALSGKHVLTTSNQDDWNIGEYAQLPAANVYGTRIKSTYDNNLAFTFTTSSTAAYILVKYGNTTRVDLTATLATVQLELGTTPTPYVPYGHIGLEVTHDGTTTVTPIPLPAKGFAASLPDGTADALTVDSAGRYVWECPTKEHTVSAIYNATDIGNGYMRGNAVLASASLTNTANAICTHAPAIANQSNTAPHFYISGTNAYFFAEAADSSALNAVYTGAEIIYQLATPTTEHGYIDLPALPSGATVSCPELDEIGVSWFVPGAAELVEHAANIKPATESRIGGVKPDGTTITVADDGTITAVGGGGGGGGYVLPPATSSTLGGVKVGSNLTIDQNGTLSAAAPYTLPNASASTLGGVKVGNGLAIDANGVLSLDIANGDGVSY